MLCLLLEEWSRSLNKTDPTVLKTPPALFHACQRNQLVNKESCNKAWGSKSLREKRNGRGNQPPAKEATGNIDF